MVWTWDGRCNRLLRRLLTEPPGVAMFQTINLMIDFHTRIRPAGSCFAFSYLDSTDAELTLFLAQQGISEGFGKPGMQ